jgi:hypothetical protein
VKPAVIIGALIPTLFFCPSGLLAQNTPSGQPITFAPVSIRPIPLQSTSGRFSSLNPPNQRRCSFNRKIIGRVVSTRLIIVDWRMDTPYGEGTRYCGRGQNRNVLVNVEFNDPADAVQMLVGRRVAITGTLKSAWENRTAQFWADFLILQKAELVAADPPAVPGPAFTSYMICQPPELDTIATGLGRELCVQNTILANLAATGSALEMAARAHTDAPPMDEASNDPNAISCRSDPGISDRNLPAIACARGSYWAWYRAKWGNPFFVPPAPP